MGFSINSSREKRGGEVRLGTRAERGTCQWSWRWPWKPALLPGKGCPMESDLPRLHHKWVGKSTLDEAPRGVSRLGTQGQLHDWRGQYRWRQRAPCLKCIWNFKMMTAEL